MASGKTGLIRFPMMLVFVLMSFCMAGRLSGVQFISIDRLDNANCQAKQRGRVERILYDSVTDEGFIKKAVYVYLPYHYEETDDQYNVFYLLHGSKERPEYYLNPQEVTKFQNLLDDMIEHQVIDPLIVAAPTWYSDAKTQSALSLSEQVRIVKEFPGELEQEILPAVEGAYRTYADSTDPGSLADTRDHRAVGGFSLGGVATWYVMLQKMNLFRYYMPLSEASWDDGTGGLSGIYDSFLSAGVINRAVASQGYSAQDFLLCAVTGTQDAAFQVMSSQMKALAFYPDTFQFGKNTCFYIVIGGKHRREDAIKYSFLGLQIVFT